MSRPQELLLALGLICCYTFEGAAIELIDFGVDSDSQFVSGSLVPSVEVQLERPIIFNGTIFNSAFVSV